MSANVSFTEFQEAVDAAKKGKFKKFFSKIMRGKEGFKKKYKDSKTEIDALKKTLKNTEKERDEARKEREECKNDKSGADVQAELRKKIEELTQQRDDWKGRVEFMEDNEYQLKVDLAYREKRVERLKSWVNRMHEVKRTGLTISEILKDERAETKKCKDKLKTETSKRHDAEFKAKTIEECNLEGAQASTLLRFCEKDLENLKKTRGCLEDVPTQSKRKLQHENDHLHQSLEKVSHEYLTCRDDEDDLKEEVAVLHETLVERGEDHTTLIKHLEGHYGGLRSSFEACKRDKQNLKDLVGRLQQGPVPPTYRGEGNRLGGDEA